MAQSPGRGLDRGLHRSRRSRRAYRAQEKNGHARRRATRHSRRSYDRKRVLHLLRRCRHGFSVAADSFFCARRGYRLSARARAEGWALRLGRECVAASMVGPSLGRLALEPRSLRGDEVPMLLLFGTGAGADARACRAAHRHHRGCACHDSCRRACADVGNCGVLRGARASRSAGGLEVLRGGRQREPRSKPRGAGGGLMENSEVRDLKNVNAEKNAKIAAFFDLDGTLLPLPSLERRFFRTLRRRREIPLRNYFAWLREVIGLLPHGIRAVTQTNKMYLKGVKSLNESDAGNDDNCAAHASGYRPEGQASAPSLKSASGRMRNNPRSPVPRFFEEALERVAQHAKLGHAIVLVSGALEPLANAVAPHLQAELANYGLHVKLHVCATKLEEIGGRWTGRILGEAM